MRTRPGPFHLMAIARALARLRGRAEVDLDEAYRIAEDLAEWYLRGEFRDDEVLALFGDPPSPRPLAEVIEGAWRSELPILEWRAVVFLAAPAVRRYLQGCGFTGAPRVLCEWFGAAETVMPQATQSTTPLAREGRAGPQTRTQAREAKMHRR